MLVTSRNTSATLSSSSKHGMITLSSGSMDPPIRQHWWRAPPETFSHRDVEQQQTQEIQRNRQVENVSGPHALEYHPQLEYVAVRSEEIIRGRDDREQQATGQRQIRNEQHRTGQGFDVERDQPGRVDRRIGHRARQVELDQAVVIG